MTRQAHRNDWTDWVTCPATGKRGFRARKAAKLAAKRSGDHTLSAYQCPDCQRWHNGNHPRRHPPRRLLPNPTPPRTPPEDEVTRRTTPPPPTDDELLKPEEAARKLRISVRSYTVEYVEKLRAERDADAAARDNAHLPHQARDLVEDSDGA